MKVRATMEGLYPNSTPYGEDWLRRYPGDVFTLFPRTINVVEVRTQRVTGQRELTVDEQFSDTWMEPVDPMTPEILTSAPKALKRATEDIKISRRPS